MTASTGQALAVDEEVTSLWIKSYQGEVLGEAYFSRMAELAQDAGERAKLEVLAALERSTRDLLLPCLVRHGLPTEPDPNIVEGVAGIDDYDWHKMLEGLPRLAGEYLGYYDRLRRLVGPEDARAADLLIAHELALELFAWRELAGQGESSLEPIQALPHLTLA